MELKSKIIMYIVKIFILVITFIAPIAIFIHTVIVLTIIDLFTAIARDMRLKKENKIEVIESRKIRKTLTKMIMYILFIISVFLMLQVTFNATFYIPNAIFGMIALVEVVSIGENMSSVTGNNVFVNATRKITKFVSNKIDKFFD